MRDAYHDGEQETPRLSPANVVVLIRRIYVGRKRNVDERPVRIASLVHCAYVMHSNQMRLSVRRYTRLLEFRLFELHRLLGFHAS